ncbi:MAG: NAD(P)/FAD-dependent oxidoreductase [Planctomycetota bacterium]|jgi:glycerol-3-phosphate dehydrogenase|nr:NAD(P)/FAD-dependent oxidoreductase [Planctomycetota bacterium]
MPDVAIIGAGVVGSAVARELSRHRLDVVVFEKGPDVASGASKANSGIVHAGHDAKPGSLKARYNLAGNILFDSLSRELDFPFRRNGSLVLALEDEAPARLEELLRQGRLNGVAGLELLGRERARELEPNLGGQVALALFAPGGGIVCPYEMTIALAENAAANGVSFQLECEALRLEREADGFRIHTPRGEFKARMLVNAAGLEADTVNNQLSRRKIRIQLRRGEYCLLDSSEAGLARHTLFPLPGKTGKGVLVTPTVDGNILLGPTSEEMEDRDDAGTTASGLERVLEQAGRYVRRLPRDRVIASFAGLRAHSLEDDFIVEAAPDAPGLVNLAGIESPGLTSAPAIALAAAKLVVERLSPAANPDFNPVRKAPPRFRHLDDAGRARLIAADSDYGRIVCRCEKVTRAEAVAALRSPLGAHSLDAVKRRTRIGMGRCQGGFCSMRLLEVFSRELGMALPEISKSGQGGNLLLGENKAGL